MEVFHILNLVAFMPLSLNFFFIFECGLIFLSMCEYNKKTHLQWTKFVLDNRTFIDTILEIEKEATLSKQSPRQSQRERRNKSLTS